MIFVLIFLFVLFWVLIGNTFIGPRNISNLTRAMTIISFLAIGMVFVIVTGNIDLSVGSATGFIATVVAFFQVHLFSPLILPLLSALFPGMSGYLLGVISTILAVIIALIVGGLIGFWNGFITAYLRVPAFIVTLGGLFIFRGLMSAVTGGKTISPIESSLNSIFNDYLPREAGVVIAVLVIVFIVSNTLWQRHKRVKYGLEIRPLIYDLIKMFFFSVLVAGFVFYMNLYEGLQIPVVMLVVVAFLFSYLAKNTRFGRYAYAIGGNKEAARLSGINIKANVLKVFIFMGMCIGIAGIMFVSRVGTGAPGGGETYELLAIASCVIGGTSLMGGEGTIIGALIGSLIMVTLDNGFVQLNVPNWAQYVIKGLVLIFAVWVDVATRKTRE
ncbi:MAG: sugar ABC transporter permease [Spirochaetales bacterium]|nr:sugar ABC transporter permease [Spirochaetales bacterium]